jgi:hypothetical protein
VTTIVRAGTRPHRSGVCLFGLLWLLTALMLSAGLLPGAASGAAFPVQARFTAPGPYATTTGTVTNSAGDAIYDLFYPSHYAALGFKSPVITWGNGTDATPDEYSTLLEHLASYGFTVIASTLENTGSGNEIDAAAHYLVSHPRRLENPLHKPVSRREHRAARRGLRGAQRRCALDPSRGAREAGAGGPVHPTAAT